MGTLCKSCDKLIKSEKNVACSGICGSFYHLKCVSLTEFAANVVNEQRNVVFLCNNCRAFIKTMTDCMEDIKKIVSENREHIAKQQESIKIISDNIEKIKDEKKSVVKEIKKAYMSNGDKPTYADQLKLPIIVKPKTQQQNKQTQSEIKSVIDPASMSLKINGMSNRQNGAVAINCNDEVSRKKIEDEVKTKLGEKYDVAIPKPVKPHVIVCGISDQWEKESLVAAMKKQNDLIGDIMCAKIFRGFKNPNVYNAVFQMESENFKKVIAMNKLRIGWEICKVYDYIPIKRCFKCWDYGHYAKECRNEMVCAKCSGNHDANTCERTDLKCSNCSKKNAKLNLNLNANHDCRSKECPVFKRRIAERKANITY